MCFLEIWNVAYFFPCTCGPGLEWAQVSDSKLTGTRSDAQPQGHSSRSRRGALAAFPLLHRALLRFSYLGTARQAPAQNKQMNLEVGRGGRSRPVTAETGVYQFVRTKLTALCTSDLASVSQAPPSSLFSGCLGR